MVVPAEETSVCYKEMEVSFSNAITVILPGTPAMRPLNHAVALKKVTQLAQVGEFRPLVILASLSLQF